MVHKQSSRTAQRNETNPFQSLVPCLFVLGPKGPNQIFWALCGPSGPAEKGRGHDLEGISFVSLNNNLLSSLGGRHEHVRLSGSPGTSTKPEHSCSLSSSRLPGAPVDGPCNTEAPPASPIEAHGCQSACKPVGAGTRRRDCSRERLRRGGPFQQSHRVATAKAAYPLGYW